MTCGFSTGYGSSTHVVNIKSGNFTGVWGLGGVGLACVMGCKDKESSTIIGIDTNPERETVGK